MNSMIGQSKKTEEIVTEVIFIRQANPRSTILILEGDDDVRFWEKFRATSCELLWAGGRASIELAFPQILHRKMRGVLGIIDADYSRLHASYTQRHGLFEYDFNSLEVMLLSSESTLNATLAEFADSKKVAAHPNGILPSILERALPYGKLRWLSVHKNLRLEFRKNLTVQQFTGHEHWKTDEIELKSKAASLVKITVESLLAELEILGTADPKEVCQGHDCIEVLSVGLVKHLGSKTPGREKLSSHLRVAFNFINLQATNLYQSIASWEQSNAPFKVLK